ncbi:retrovirus-related pol polyprotein from transposon TNT 1-94 [Tanacetum coccineum]|uniref:Retrovirus-related pol polyprotein from transposon TNT 1-94 n=1 Tax=Tanacetum coccineum TaxID=301880 RepID=A0ABQ4XYP0_9ASTR
MEIQLCQFKQDDNLPQILKCDELYQFDRLKVWELVDKPFGKMIIKLKWLWKNKKDEDQTDNSQQSTTFARLEAVFGFSAAYAAHNSISNLSDGRKMHFLMVTEGEVYVLQPEGFVDPEHPEKSLLLMESLYGLKQAPRAWYDELSNFLMSKGFTKKAKYALEILKKHNMDNCHSIGTPLATKPKLDVDLSGEPVDQSDYRSKIGSLMYLTSSRPDLVQAVCYCARYQARPTQKHLKEVKRIFKYLKGTINIGLWYPKDSGFELTAFSDADHAGCIDTRKSTSGGIQFLGDKLVSWMSKKQNCTAMSSAEAEYVALSASSLLEDQFKYLVRRIGMRCLTPADLEVLTNETA